MCPALGSEWWQPACLSLLQGEEIQVSFPVLPRGILSFLSHLPQECLITRARDKCIISHLKTESHEQGAGIERKEGSHALPTGTHQSSNAGEMQSCGITREKPSSFCRWRHLWCWASFPWWCQELCPRAGYGQPSGMLSRGNPVGSEERPVRCLRLDGKGQGILEPTLRVNIYMLPRPCLWHLCLCQVLALGMTFPLITCKVSIILQAAAQCFHYFF